MSPNMQVLMIEQVHLGLKQTMQLMHKHVHRSYLAVAQKAFFFQFVFTVGSLQKAFGFVTILPNYSASGTRVTS